MQKVHGKSAATSGSAPSEKSVPNRVGGTLAGPELTREQRRQQDALRQNDNLSRFGGKYIGYMSREFDGRFGSLPLYDDYGDEAEAD